MTRSVSVPLELIDAIGGMMIKVTNELQGTYNLPQIMQAYWYVLGYLVAASGGRVPADQLVLDVHAFALGYECGQESETMTPGVQ